MGAYEVMAGQAGSKRITASFKPANRSIVVTSHWDSVDEMLVEANAQYGRIEWYQIKDGPKIMQ